MDKLKYIKLENEDGSYSDDIPLAVDSNHVDVNGNTLTNELANKATKTEVQALASGSPAGVYETVSALTTADPDHERIYIVATNGHWYYYNNGWQDGGIYQAAEDSESILNIENKIDALDNQINNYEIEDMNLVTWTDGYYVSPTNGKAYTRTNCSTSSFIEKPDSATSVIIESINSYGSAGYGLYSFNRSGDSYIKGYGKLYHENKIKIDLDSDIKFIRITSDTNAISDVKIIWLSDLIKITSDAIESMPIFTKVFTTTVSTVNNAGSNSVCSINYRFKYGFKYKINIETGSFDTTYEKFYIYLNDYSYVKGKLHKIYERTSSLQNIKLDIDCIPDDMYSYLLFRITNVTGSRTITYTVTITEFQDNMEMISSGDLKYNFVRFPYQEINPLLVATSTHLTNVTKNYHVPITLIHYSDIHLDSTRAKHITDFKNIYKNYVDGIIMTGDACGSTYFDYNHMYETEELKDHLFCIGNHDVYDHNGDAATHGDSYDNKNYWATATEKYNQYIKPSISNWNVIQPENAELNGYCYYAKNYIKSYDGNQTKVKLIVLDAMAYDELQHNWLIDTLQDALENNFSVVIANHFMPTESTIDFNLFNTGFASTIRGMEAGYGNSYLGYLDDQDIRHRAAEAVDNFINNGGDFVCWLCGHMHYGMVGTLNSHPNQIFIAIEKAKWDEVWADTPRAIDSPTEDLFNVVSIDTFDKIIRVVRIGAKYDYKMRHKESMCIDYANRTLISTF